MSEDIETVRLLAQVHEGDRAAFEAALSRIEVELERAWKSSDRYRGNQDRLEAENKRLADMASFYGRGMDKHAARLHHIEEAARKVIGTINNGVMPNESAQALLNALNQEKTELK